MREDGTLRPAVVRARRLRLLLRLMDSLEASGLTRRSAVVDEIVRLQLERMRRRAAWRLHAPSMSCEEVEIVVAMALVRLASALAKAQGARESSVIALVNSCVDFAAVDFVRERVRRRRLEQVTDPELIPQFEVYDASTLEHAHAVNEMLAGLSARESQIVSERVVLSLTPDEIAARHRITRGAVYVAYSRALTKLRAGAQAAGREP